MKFALGCDHRGFAAKQALLAATVKATDENTR
jgi:hypothetical protein